MIKKRILIFLSLSFFLTAIYLQPAIPFSANQKVRIAVFKGPEEFGLTIKGTYKIINSFTGEIYEEGKNSRERKVTSGIHGVQIGSLEFGKRVRIITNKEVVLKIKRRNRHYRGEIDIYKKGSRDLLVVNTLDIEDYIRGVLYHEVDHRWPMEALKTQAVAARTYAVYQLEQNKNQDYDVTSDIYSQVYGGKSAERYRTNLAVKETEGEIMFYRGKVLPAYYHATCGGFTEDARELWKHDFLPPLKGKECNFCIHSPHYRWKKNFRSKTVSDKLNEKGYAIGLIKTIEVLHFNASGRVNDLLITSREGKSLIL